MGKLGEDKMNDYLVNMENAINGNERWKLLEELYNRNYLLKKNSTEIDNIPKIIHQIWLGGDFPQRYEKYRKKMLKINSNWAYRLWTDNDVESFRLKNRELYNNIKNLGAKSDIFRYEILERFGGLYVDVDFDFVKSFDDLCHLNFFAGNGHMQEPYIFNSIIASSSNHKIISALVSGLQKKESFFDDIEGVMNNTGPYFLTNVFFENINLNDNVVIFPTKFLFPFPAVHRNSVDDSEKSQKFIYSFLNENSYCMHLWHTNWQK